ncbi:hypothetical protein TRAPUB_11753 [Trametes pubescens]|uniref:F-box domain-containing protein n=1 Tax=Trametes pubescens TaxID=154538 RepID=A0A1M2VVU2_TRAPU|nr:hypothetical protein TRAPUB_11753 [Trametes pubescens]
MIVTSQAPRLSQDILLELLNHVQRQSDVSTLMRTCKTLRDAGTRPLLSHGVTVANATQLRTFCAYVLRDVPNRAPHLRRLYLKIRLEPNVDDEPEDDSDAKNSYSSATLSKDTLRMLVTVLRKTTNLEDLSIDSSEELLERENKLVNAIIALERVRRLQVHSVGELTGRILDNIKSSLVEIDLHCYSEEMYDPSPLIPMAGHHRDTLEKLSGWYVELGDATVRFPRVRALALRSFWGLDTATLHHAFPSLQYLELSVPADLDAEPTRQENAAAAENHPWGVLRRLCGAVDALYALGTAPRAKVVEADYIGSYDATMLARFRTVLSESGSSHAVLHLGYGYGFSLPAEKIPDLLPIEGAVTHLALDIRTGSVMGAVDDVLSQIVSLLRRHKVAFLVLRLHDTLEDAEDGDDEDGPAPIKPPSPEFLRVFGRPRHEDIIQLFSEASTSLKHVALDVKGTEATYWAVERTGAGLSVERLSSAAGRALVCAEELASTDRSLGLQGVP